jgi:hypothetical protein
MKAAISFDEIAAFAFAVPGLWMRLLPPGKNDRVFERNLEGAGGSGIGESESKRLGVIRHLAVLRSRVRARPEGRELVAVI